MTNIDRYIKLRRLIQDFLLGQDTSSQIAGILGVTPSSLRKVLFRDGLIDVTGRPNEGLDTQDFFNCILLSYSIINIEKVKRK